MGCNEFVSQRREVLSHNGVERISLKEFCEIGSHQVSDVDRSRFREQRLIQELSLCNVLEDANAPNVVRTDFFGTRLDIQLEFTHERFETRFQEFLFLLLMKIKGGSCNIGPLGNIGYRDLIVASFDDELKQRLTKQLARSLNTPINGGIVSIQHASCRVEETGFGSVLGIFCRGVGSLIHFVPLSLNRQFYLFCSRNHEKANRY